MKNPIPIPKSFEEINDDGSKILYRVLSIQGRDIRVLKYYNEKGLLKRVNVWGICGKLKEFKDRGGYFVAYDEEIDFKELGGYIKAEYPGIELLFF